MHAGGKVSRPPDLRRNLLYVIIAEATNMGLSAMAESCGIAVRRAGLDRRVVLQGGNAGGGQRCDRQLPPSAIKEYGALRRTVYTARYLADETYRRRIGRQLNKGENLHALKRSLAYANEGALRRRHHELQTEQMWCLTIAANAVVTWTSEYNGLAVTALRRAGRDIDDAVAGPHLADPSRERPLLRHPLRRRRRRARPARRRWLPAAAPGPGCRGNRADQAPVTAVPADR